MPGGLLNLVSFGNQNIILNGNPSKTMFKFVYAKYTNFGLQKFRLDFDGARTLRLNESSTFDFKIPRYADLLMDTYLVVQLPTIWSPIFPPQDCSGKWVEYGYKWIKNLGSQMIKEVQISIGGQIIAQYSGQYLYNMVERDFPNDKKNLYYKMSGNVAELNDPANSNGNVNMYPNAYYTTNQAGPEPSIRARKLYIPINTWFTLNNKMAFPLVALQYNELIIDITMRPIQELCVIRDVGDENNVFAYIQPNFNNPYQGFYRFLQPPPDVELGVNSYADKRTNWNADIHLISTYAFLTEEEEKVFALNQQRYLIKEVHEYKFNNVTGSNVVELDTLGMVSNWMWYYQRDDSNLRNEWSNYTNWSYDYLPYGIVNADTATQTLPNPCTPPITPNIKPDENPDGNPTGYFITPNYTPQNEKNILRQFGILMDGKYRENLFDGGIYNYVEKYVRTSSNSPDGLYCYNFGLKTDPFDFQPNGAINMSKFKTIEMEFSTITPVLDPSAAFYQICDPVTKTIIGVNKPSWIIYDYNFNLTVMEERYNVLTFMSGNAALDYAR